MKPTPEEVKYWQGVMDGIATVKYEVLGAAQEAQGIIARNRHVHYSSWLGPYCAICKEAMTSENYEPYWSKE